MKKNISTIILLVSLSFNLIFTLIYFSPVQAHSSDSGRTLVLNSKIIYNNPQKSGFAKRNYNYFARESRFMNIYSYPSEAVFLGDSITQNFDWNEAFPGSKNRGIVSDTTAGVKSRLDSIIKLKPEKIFIMIGVNDIASAIPESTIIKNYGEIIDKLKESLPSCTIYVQSILPVAKPCTVNPAKIASANTSIKKLCKSKDITFIDLTKAMSDENGSLKSGYHNDGIHLTTAGYAAWIKQIDKYY